MGVQVIEQDPITTSPAADHEHQQLVLSLDGFTWQAAEQESSRLGVSAQELATFALLYYLADLDSGRIAREIPAQERQS